MKIGRGSAVLDERLEPVTRCFNLDVARALDSLRVDERTQARVEELAGKCNEGGLTQDELREYEAYTNAGALIDILQSKARRILNQSEPR